MILAMSLVSKDLWPTLSSVAECGLVGLVMSRDLMLVLCVYLPRQGQSTWGGGGGGSNVSTSGLLLEHICSILTAA